MAGYTRQDTANNISNGSVIDADDFDAEYNAVEAAFNASTGHAHDGSAGEGAPIEKVGPLQDLIVSTTQVIPKTTNTLDLGSASVQFKNAWFDGTVDTDALAVSGSTTVGGTLDVTGTITGDLTGDLTGNVTGNVTGDLTGNVTSTGTATFTTVDVNGGAIDGTTIGSNNAAAVTGTTITATTGFVGDLTGDVTGDLTGNADTATTWETSRSLTLTGDVAGTVTGIDGSGNISVATTVQANSVALGTDTTGSYVGSLVAGTGITLTNNSGEGATPTIAIGQPVGTSSSVTFGNVTVGGNLTVSGTTTTVNSNDVNIADSTLTLNSDETGTPSQDAGIVIERGTEPNKSFIWDESEDKWSTGGETLVAPLEGNASTATALQTARNIAGQSFNGTASIDIAPTDLTGVTATAAELNTASTHYVPSGGIIIWSGAANAVPTGWVICDGTNSTPNLQDKFIVGVGTASTYAVGDTGGAATVTLSAAQMPQHRHYASVSGSTNTTGAHSHTYLRSTSIRGGGGTDFNIPMDLGSHSTTTQGNHSHSVSAAGYTDYQGSNSAHENLPPYYALAYIMKT